MLTMALDTANRRGGFALARDGVILASRPVEATDGFAGLVYGELESLLAEQGCSARDVDLWAAAAGPGSFTGVRIGLAAAKALAEASGTQAIAIGNLESLAFGVPGTLRAAVLDARRGQAFWAVYDDQSRAVVEPSIGTWEAVRDELTARALVPAVAERGPLEENGIVDFRLVDNSAVPLALLAEARAASGEALATEGIQPVYVRKPDVREPN